MTPSSRRAAVSTISRTEAMPERWPSTRGRLRDFAQRPLSSMITATWRGRRLRSMRSRRVSSIDPGSASLERSIIVRARWMLVPNLFEQQTLGRRGPARLLERFADDLSASDLDERPRDAAHHEAEEAV